jgi:hypothetical protein
MRERNSDTSAAVFSRPVMCRLLLDPATGLPAPPASRAGRGR